LQVIDYTPTTKNKQIKKGGFMQNYKLFSVMTLFLSAFLFSCSKKDQTIENKGYTTAEMKIYRQLVSFNQMMKSDLKTETYMGIDSTVWYLETLFNVQNGYPDSCSESTISFELNYELPLVNDRVSMTSISQTYNNMVSDLDSLLNMFEVNVKFLLMADLSMIDYHNNILQLQLISMIGINPSALYEPFTTDDNWHYGEMYGRCDGLFVGQSDGGEEIERRINNPRVNRNRKFLNVNYTNAFGYEEPQSSNPFAGRIYFEQTNIFPPCISYSDLTYYLLEAHDICYRKISQGGLIPDQYDFGILDVKSGIITSLTPTGYHHYYVIWYGDWVQLPPLRNE
jgi:hypothetical protein